VRLGSPGCRLAPRTEAKPKAGETGLKVLLRGEAGAAYGQASIPEPFASCITVLERDSHVRTGAGDKGVSGNGDSLTCARVLTGGDSKIGFSGRFTLSMVSELAGFLSANAP
jgi:hypothetical protein